MWTENYKLIFPEAKTNKHETNNKYLNRINAKLKELEKQSENIHDLLERGIYDAQKFLERQKIIAEKTANLENEKSNIEKTQLLQKENKLSKSELLPKTKKLMQLYPRLNSSRQKNVFLKEIVDKIIYTRKQSGRWVDADNFEIDIYPKI